MNQTTNRTSRPQMVLTMGGPAAGKSTVLAREYPDLPVVDCDAIKAQHPDYDPKNPSALHAWSSQQAVREVYARLARGESFAFDSTGSAAERMIRMAHAAHDAGFDVVVLYVACPLNVALARNARRERVVPEEIVREKHAMVAVAFDLVSRHADQVRIF